jgi:3D (Asp-Asp-Asp) domain-containing protein
VHGKKVLTGCLLLGLGLSIRAGAQTFTLQAAADTSLRSGAANQNHGSDPTLQLSHDGRVLVRFDQGALASTVGAGRLVSASLELFVHSASGWGAAGHPVEAHPLTTDWTEAGATWNCAVDTNPANNKQDCATPWAGGTFADDASDTVLQTKDTGVWLTLDVTADVAAFLAGTPNQGWLIEKSDGDQSGKAEYTSREGAAAERPRLVLLVETAANDQVPPSLAITSPSQPVLVNDPAPTIALAYADGGSGVDLATLQVLVDGQDVTTGCAVGPQSATCPAPTLAAGNHTVQALLRDRAGNAAQASAAFQLLLGPGPHVVTLQTVGDTDLRGGEADRNFGADPVLRVRESGPNRSLVQFDASSLTSTLAGATLVSASLELHIGLNGRNWGKAGRPVEAHRLTGTWTELGATWDCPNDSNTTNRESDCATPWAGGSFAPAPTASVLHTRDLAGWVTFDVTADVAAFAAGGPDFGWLLKKADETQSGRVDYDSREGAAGEAPRLVLVFTTSTGVDITPPVVAITAPAEGSFVASATPTVTATYSDASSGVDAASVRLTVDGVDVTAQAQLTASGLTFTPTASLADGAHTIGLVVKDRAGNPAQASRRFGTDTVVPALVITSPADQTGVGTLALDVALAFSDVGSGIDPASLKVAIDDIDESQACTLTGETASCHVPDLRSGTHTILAEIHDRAGNSATSSSSVSLLPGVIDLAVTIGVPADGSFVNTPVTHITGTVSGAGPGLAVSVNGTDAAVAADGTFQADIPLAEGGNPIEALASDNAGGFGSVDVEITLDTQAPDITLNRPAPAEVFNAPSAHVAGQVTDREESGVASVTVNGVVVPVLDEGFETDVTLAAGANTIVVHAVDNAGNARDATTTVTLSTLPAVAITSPADLSTIAATTVDVTGTVSDPAAAVAVNGQATTVGGGTFTARDVPLIEGGNVLTVTATTADGRVGTRTVNVVRDLEPPHLSIDAPLAGEMVFEPAVTVSGLVNDIVAGTVNASEATVTVNGRPAAVSNRSFVATSVPLAPGDNALTVVARDTAGNQAQASVTVHLAQGAAHVAIVSGDGQQGTIGAALSQPLVVKLLDAAGAPVAGSKVLFTLRDNNGSLDGGVRQMISTTDSAGRASAGFTLGTHAGVQRVEAGAPGFAGPVFFTLTASPGPASLIVVDAGDQQVGTAGLALPRPLVAAVTDAGSNRVAGVPVRFTVALGQGHFEDSSREKLVTTDSDGRVVQPFVLDSEEGAAGNVVWAAIDALPDGPTAIFTATGWAAGDPAQTAVTGVVLDNSNLPLKGATIRILDTAFTTTTDDNGFFRIAGAPVGTIKMIVDGSTVARPGSWPDLEFVLTTVAGRENSLDMPIFLLPIDLSHGVVVDETHGGTVILPAFPGFSLEVSPGSVTFPGGGKSGVVSATLVHVDKVPMVPNFGQQPRFIVTIQPAGARFDPPARLTLPNVDGLAPGEVTELYSFDHDLGHFVSIGPATVSSDGRRIVSNPGVGVLKAGWTCGGKPNSSGTAHECGDCAVCVKGFCQAKPGTPKCKDDGDNCTRDICKGGYCQHLPKSMASVSFKLTNHADGQPNGLRFDTQPANFSGSAKSVNCQGDTVKYKWDFGDGGTAQGQTASHSWDHTGEFTVKLKAQCGDCDHSAKETSKKITAGFLATCYIIADENDYSGPTVTNQHGLTGTYVESFLRGVQLQGSGRAANGNLIQIDFSRGNYRNFSTIFFHVVAQITTASGQPLTAGTSIAVSNIIPLGTTVTVGGGIGVRRADDTGGRITGYHIDVFGGFGEAACTGWANPIVPIEGY